MKQLNSHQFKEIYEAEGIELNKLGCVMLDTEPIPKPLMYDLSIPEAFYTSPDEKKFWIKGYVADQTPHVTLLYGLLTPANEQPENIATVLEGWEIDSVTVKEFGYFESPMADEPYYCIVGHIEVTPKLLEGHERLEFLPHVNTFSGYKPHITIAYVKKDIAIRDRVINDLNKLYAGRELTVSRDLNLGGNK
jgi:2'-5' RNA ligase